MLFDDAALEATFGEFLLTAQAGALLTSGLGICVRLCCQCWRDKRWRAPFLSSERAVRLTASFNWLYLHHTHADGHYWPHPALGTIFINCSTVDPALPTKLAERGKARALEFLSAPVFGRPDAAANKQCLVITSGDPAALDKVRAWAAYLLAVSGFTLDVRGFM